MVVLLAVHATRPLLWPVRPGSHLLAGQYVACGVRENERFPQGSLFMVFWNAVICKGFDNL